MQGYSRKFFFYVEAPPPPPFPQGLTLYPTVEPPPTVTFFCLQGGHWGEVQPQASQALASRRRPLEFVRHASFLPNGRPWGRNECVKNELQRTSAGRLPKLTLRVCNVNLLSHAAVGVASQAIVQTYISMGNKILRFANAKYHSFLLFFL